MFFSCSKSATFVKIHPAFRILRVKRFLQSYRRSLRDHFQDNAEIFTIANLNGVVNGDDWLPNQKKPALKQR